MVIFISILYILQLIILLVWLVNAVIEESKEMLPSFVQAFILLFIPLGFIPMLLFYLYKNDKNKL